MTANRHLINQFEFEQQLAVEKQAQNFEKLRKERHATRKERAFADVEQFNANKAEASAALAEVEQRIEQSKLPALQSQLRMMGIKQRLTGLEESKLRSDLGLAQYSENAHLTGNELERQKLQAGVTRKEADLDKYIAEVQQAIQMNRINGVPDSPRRILPQ